MLRLTSAAAMLLAATTMSGTITGSAKAEKICNLLAQEQYYRDVANGRPTAGDPCPEDTARVQDLVRSGQNLYNIEVRMYGRQAVLECRSRMSNRSPMYDYCLEANKGRR